MNSINAMPSEGFLRERQILGDPKAEPPVPAIIPIAHSTWWNGIKCGRYPRGIKLGPKTTVWRVSDIRALLDGGAA